jgi:hypothetical protein
MTAHAFAMVLIVVFVVSSHVFAMDNVVIFTIPLLICASHVIFEKRLALIVVFIVSKFPVPDIFVERFVGTSRGPVFIGMSSFVDVVVIGVFCVRIDEIYIKVGIKIGRTSTGVLL